MQRRLAERIAYGCRVRERAACLLEAHGWEASREAASAAEEAGLTEQERAFWLAVAARAERMAAIPAKPRSLVDG